MAAYNNYLIFITLLCLSSIPILVNSISFRISDFSDPSILYQGDAVNVSSGVIEFNKVDYSSRVGVITYADEVHLWDGSSGKVSDLSTNFSFSIDTLNQSSGHYGHGFTFFMAPTEFEIPLNSNGGFLGLFNTTTCSSNTNQMIVVEFDSFSNKEWDPAYEHVGINKGSIESTKYTRWNASEHSGDIADVRVTYKARTQKLNVVWSYRNEVIVNTRTNNPSISLNIDLKEAIPESVVIGFSAATDQYVERHRLHSWEFSSNLKVKVESTTFELLIGVMAPFCFLFLGGAIVSYIVK